MTRLSQVTDRIVGRFAKSRKADLTYESLALLSNSSRADALRTMSKLSFRLSRQSLPVEEMGHRTHRSHRGHHAHRQNANEESHGMRHKRKGSTHSKTPSSSKQSVCSSSSSNRLHRCSAGCEGGLRRKSAASLSRATVSTGSTNLGEVSPERRTRTPSSTPRTRLSRATLASTDTSWCTYDVKPTYPLHPYAPEHKSRGFLGIFRR